MGPLKNARNSTNEPWQGTPVKRKLFWVTHEGHPVKALQSCHQSKALLRWGILNIKQIKSYCVSIFSNYSNINMQLNADDAVLSV